MSLLVFGTMAIDSVKTPFGAREEAVGGSATYFSVAASYFTEVRLVAVVGDDFPEETLAFLGERGVDASGLDVRPGKKTFRWKGEYGFDLNTAHTLDTRLNVVADAPPGVPEGFRDSEFVFLANIAPTLQAEALAQTDAPRLSACDTMDFWINGKREELLKTLSMVDMVVVNDAEARALSGEPNIARAARRIREIGPGTLVVKRGEYGALLFHGEEDAFSAPGLPMEDARDPTGAGDSFAGGFMGHLAATGDLSAEGMRRAVVFGSVMASFNVEAFSYDRMKTLTRADIEARYRAFAELARFERL